VLVICRGTHSISYLDDSPIQGASFDEHLISLPINIFLAGDLAFLSTLLGKENMSTAWCPWCILSKVQWSASNHKPGQLWTIDNIVDICEKVDWKELSEDPELLRGFTKLPLFDLIPIQNYIVPVLHILIGVGNAVVNAIYGLGAQATKKEKVQRVEGLRRIFWAMGDAKREVEKSLGKVSRYGSKLKKAASLC